MSKRLNKEKQKELEPKRIEYAKGKIKELGFDIHNETPYSFCFFFKGEAITFFPYSGWYTGKTIKDGRGLDNLLKQLK